MRRSMSCFAMLLASIALLSVPPAHAMNWSLGANLGLSVEMPEDGSDVTVLEWPYKGVVPAGLRLGFANEGSPHEIYFDNEFGWFDSDDVSGHSLSLTANLLYALSPGITAPYLTGGLGFVNVGSHIETGFGDFSASATSITLGLGVGLRHRLANGHGAVRGEVRYDRLTEGEDHDVVVIDEAGVLSLKFGFDLWMK